MGISSNCTYVEADVFSKSFEDITKVHAVEKSIKENPVPDKNTRTSSIQTRDKDGRGAQKCGQDEQCVSCPLDQPVSVY
jgi:hypothetical protein